MPRSGCPVPIQMGILPKWMGRLFASGPLASRGALPRVTRWCGAISRHHVVRCGRSVARGGRAALPQPGLWPWGAGPRGLARCGPRARRSPAPALAEGAVRAGRLCAGNLMLMAVGSCSSPSRPRQIKALGLVPEGSDRCSLPLLCFPPFILLANACHIFTAPGNGRRVHCLNRRRWHRAARLPPSTCPASLPSRSGIPLVHFTTQRLPRENPRVLGVLGFSLLSGPA